MKVKVISLPYIFQVLYLLCFTRPRYQVSVYRTIGPLVYYVITKFYDESYLILFHSSFHKDLAKAATKWDKRRFSQSKRAFCPGYGAKRPLSFKNKIYLLLYYIESFCPIAGAKRPLSCKNKIYLLLYYIETVCGFIVIFLYLERYELYTKRLRTIQF